MENGNKQGVVFTSAARIRASGPILILAILFVVAVFLSWYLTWFGRGLSDAEISEYLNDERHPRHVQHALLQIQERMEKGDVSVSQWYQRIVELAANPETEFRLTAAWLMGSDNRSDQFHQALLKLLQDPEPIVRRNAALALLRFNDNMGRPEMLAILSPYIMRTPLQGTVVSTLKEGAPLSRGTMLARIKNSDRGVVEVRSPLPGKIQKILASNGSEISAGDSLLTIRSDDESIWESLRGLALAGQSDDLPLIESYSQSDPAISEKIREQAKLTVDTIRTRLKT
ncbi:MAG TPA: HEAT repeat domain-containing protein [Pyrinomonadaceae bacterium]